MDPMAMMMGSQGGQQMGPMMGQGPPPGPVSGQCPGCGGPQGQCPCGGQGMPQQWAMDENTAPVSDMAQDPYGMGSVNLALMLGDSMAPADQMSPPMDLLLQLLGQQGQQQVSPATGPPPGMMAGPQMGQPGMAPGFPIR